MTKPVFDPPEQDEGDLFQHGEKVQLTKPFTTPLGDTYPAGTKARFRYFGSQEHTAYVTFADDNYQIVPAHMLEPIGLHLKRVELHAVLPAHAAPVLMQRLYELVSREADILTGGLWLREPPRDEHRAARKQAKARGLSTR